MEPFWHSAEQLPTMHFGMRTSSMGLPVATCAYFNLSSCPTLAHQTATLVLDPFCGSGSTLLAAEILETDFWIQYNELGGVQDSEVPGGSGSHKYTKALEVLDGDMPQYIHDN